MQAPVSIVAGALLACAVSAAQSAQTSDGAIAYVTGAVSSEELQALAGEKGNYSVWITTAAQGSGAFLSDAQVRIIDPRKNVVLDEKVIGPWLFVDLPAGLYQVEAMFEGQVQHRSLRVGAKRPQQVIMYFDTQAALSPDWRSPFAQSPYSAR